MLSLGVLFSLSMLGICHAKETTESTQLIQNEVDNSFLEFFYCDKNDEVDFNKISDFYKSMYSDLT